MAVDLEPPWLDERYGSVRYGPRGLPAHSIGRQNLAWGMAYMTIPDGELAGNPWVPTPEQARFVVWLFAIDQEASTPQRPRWLYRRGALRRMKGAGKDPLAAFLSVLHLVGPVVPVWDAQTGQWVGVPHRSPWIQLAAVSQSQTRNTGSLFAGMLPERTRRKFKIDVAATIVHSPRGRIEAITSSPLAAEGPRTTLGIINEPQNWLESNGGHAMYRVIRRNAAKVGGRLIEIGNAPQRGQDSVAERTEKAYNTWRAGKTVKPLRLLYDAREAPPDSRLDTAVDLRAGIRAARGDSFWVDFDDIETEVASPDITPAESRRFYLNRSVTAEDAWCDPNDWEALANPRTIPDGRDVVIFGDLSKSIDATAVLACDIETGHIQTLDVWSRPNHGPEAERADKWNVPRHEVQRTLIAALARWNVKALFLDPGSGEDDEGKKYWDTIIDNVSRLMDDDRSIMWAVTTGPKKHKCRWDMRSRAHTEVFTRSAEQTSQDILDRVFTQDGHPVTHQHVANAKLRPNDFGVSMGKDHSESSFHVDAAVAMVGARMTRALYRQWVSGRRIPRAGSVSGVVAAR